MIPYQDYSYILSVRQSSGSPSICSIQDFFNSPEFYPITFNTDENYYDESGTAMGSYRFCQVDEIKEVAQKSAWPQVSNCPFIGSILGYCLISPWDHDSFHFLVERTLNLGCGFIANLTNGVFFDIVAEKELSLREVVGRHGFNEGSLYLINTKDYHTYIRNSISKSLKPLDLKPNSYHGGDHDHILDGFEGDKKNRSVNWQKFEIFGNSVLLKLWVTDWDGFQKVESSLLDI